MIIIGAKEKEPTNNIKILNSLGMIITSDLSD